MKESSIINVTNEEWKDIKGYENLYQVSTKGRVKSLLYKKEKILKGSLNSEKYFTVHLKGKTYAIHRLVAETFLERVEGKNEIDHINTNRNDNYIENLRWVTHKENCNNPLTIQKYKKIKRYYKSRIITKETIEKIRQTKATNKENGKRINGKTVICITTGKIFTSAVLASEYYNIRSSDIIACCKGKRKSCGKLNNEKLIWEYYKI